MDKNKSSLFRSNVNIIKPSNFFFITCQIVKFLPCVTPFLTVDNMWQTEAKNSVVACHSPVLVLPPIYRRDLSALSTEFLSLKSFRRNSIRGSSL